MLNWKNVVFEGKLDGHCDQCDRWTRQGGSWQEDYVTYDFGGWLGDYFYCHNCLERLLGPMPEPSLKSSYTKTEDNPFTYAE